MSKSKKTLLDYRSDTRGIAFMALIKSWKKNIIIVEGINDLISYRSLIKDKKNIIIQNAKLNDSSIKKLGKISILNLYSIIEKIDPNNHKIAYLVDKDYDKKSYDPPIYNTDYHSLENYSIIWDRYKNQNSFTNRITSLEENSQLSILKDFFREKEEDCSQITIDEKLEKKILEGMKGKDLIHLLKKNNNSKHELIFSHLSIDDVPVLKKIIDNFDKD